MLISLYFPQNKYLTFGVWKHKNQMNMKRIFLLLIALSLFNLSFTDGDEKETKKKKLSLNGKLTDLEDAKSGASATVFAFMDDETLEIGFLQAYSNLTITIEDFAGIIVYCDTINATAGMVYPIDISTLGAGIYLLKIADAYGGILTGYFTL